MAYKRGMPTYKAERAKPPTAIGERRLAAGAVVRAGCTIKGFDEREGGVFGTATGTTSEDGFAAAPGGTSGTTPRADPKRLRMRVSGDFRRKSGIA